jgi:FixJ family two-component response regulator
MIGPPARPNGHPAPALLRAQIGPDLRGEVLTATLDALCVRLDSASSFDPEQEVTVLVEAEFLPTPLAFDGTMEDQVEGQRGEGTFLHRIRLDMTRSDHEALHSLLDHYHGNRLREATGHVDLIGVAASEVSGLCSEAWTLNHHEDVDEFLDHHHWTGYGCLVLTDQYARAAGQPFYRLLRAMGDDHATVILTSGENPLLPAELIGPATVFNARASASDGELRAVILHATQVAREQLRTRWLSALAEVRIGSLSRREREVLDHILQGLSSKAISAAMDISKRTVDNHRVAIMRKLGAHSIAELIVMAMASYTYGGGRAPQTWASVP